MVSKSKTKSSVQAKPKAKARSEAPQAAADIYTPLSADALVRQKFLVAEVRGNSNYVLMSYYRPRGPHPITKQDPWGVLTALEDKMREGVRPEDVCAVIAEHHMELYTLRRVPNKDGDLVGMDGQPARDDDGRPMYPRYIYKAYTRHELIEILRGLNAKPKHKLKNGTRRFDVPIAMLKMRAFPSEDVKGHDRGGIWAHVLVAAGNDYVMHVVPAVFPPRAEPAAVPVEPTITAIIADAHQQFVDASRAKIDGIARSWPDNTAARENVIVVVHKDDPWSKHQVVQQAGLPDIIVISAPRREMSATLRSHGYAAAKQLDDAPSPGNVSVVVVAYGHATVRELTRSSP